MEWPHEEETLRTQRVKVEHLERPAAIFSPFPSLPRGEISAFPFYCCISEPNKQTNKKRLSQSLGFPGRAGAMV